MIFLVFFFGILGTVLSADDNILCTSDFCKDVTCSNLPEKCQIQNATHNGIFLPSPSACNCCDYCIENLNEGEECSAGDITDPSPSTICGPGLYCKPTEGTDGLCSRMISNCFKTQDDYDKRRENGTLGSMEVRQDCDSEGEFVPYKCIPGQTCYCNNSTGSRIFGESDYTSLPATDLHCKCSRDYEEAVALIGRQLRPDEFFHCAPNGDYEVVQCMNEQCFCVDAIDGAPTYPDEPPVNLTDLSKETLKCYTKKEEGIFYQKCETEYLKILKEYKKYKNDGYRMVLGYDFPLCDVDGTYQAVQENDTHKFCVDKEGAILNTIDKKANATLANNMNCKCARARLVTTSNEPPTCDDNGNYSVKQTRRGRVRCVDMNGNQVCNKKNCEVDEGQSLTCPTQK